MNSGWIVLVEGIAIFALLIGFGVWQLRSLKKMEREDKAKAEGEGGSEGEVTQSAFMRPRNTQSRTAPSSSAQTADADSPDAGHPER